MGPDRGGGAHAQNRKGREVSGIGSLVVEADFTQAFRREFVVSLVALGEPYLFVETDRKGDIVNPSLPEKEMEKKGPDMAVARPAFIRKLRVRDGSIDYLDGKVRKVPVATRFRGVTLDMEAIRLPFAEERSSFDLTARIQGTMSTAAVASRGSVTLGTMDAECTVQVKDLDITDYKPYYRREADVDIAKGLLDLNMVVSVKSKRIHAHGEAVLKGISFAEKKGLTGYFKGIPLTLVKDALEEHGGRLPVKFTLTGDLEDPKFDLREVFVRRLMVGIAEKLGFSLKKWENPWPRPVNRRCGISGGA